MLEPCWHYFSLLGASWLHLVLLTAFVVVLGCFLCVSGRSGLGFGGSRGGPGSILEAPGTYFSMFFRACAFAVRTQPERRFVL